MLLFDLHPAVMVIAQIEQILKGAIGFQLHTQYKRCFAPDLLI